MGQLNERKKDERLGFRVKGFLKWVWTVTECINLRTEKGTEQHNILTSISRIFGIKLFREKKLNYIKTI